MVPQQQPSERQRTRIVAAPQPTDPAIPPSIFSIEVREDQDVQWHWLDLPDGNRVAIDYDLIERSYQDSPNLPA